MVTDRKLGPVTCLAISADGSGGIFQISYFHEGDGNKKK